MSTNQMPTYLRSPLEPPFFDGQAQEVEPAAKRAKVGGGVLLSDLASATSPHALAAPAFGHISHTGVGGLTLGGGIGWIMRK